MSMLLEDGRRDLNQMDDFSGNQPNESIANCLLHMHFSSFDISFVGCFSLCNVFGIFHLVKGNFHRCKAREFEVCCRKSKRTFQTSVMQDVFLPKFQETPPDVDFA